MLQCHVLYASALFCTIVIVCRVLCAPAFSNARMAWRPCSSQQYLHPWRPVLLQRPKGPKFFPAQRSSEKELGTRQRAYYGRSWSDGPQRKFHRQRRAGSGATEAVDTALAHVCRCGKALGAVVLQTRSCRWPAADCGFATASAIGMGAYRRPKKPSRTFLHLADLCEVPDLQEAEEAVTFTTK